VAARADGYQLCLTLLVASAVEKVTVGTLPRVRLVADLHVGGRCCIVVMLLVVVHGVLNRSGERNHAHNPNHVLRHLLPLGHFSNMILSMPAHETS